jgi:hypothetical protein
MRVKKRFEVKCPALWAEIDTFEESTYDETIKIVKGVGYCDSADSAERLRNFGYTIRDLYLEKEKEYDDKQREATRISKSNNSTNTRSEAYKGSKKRTKTTK